MFGSLRVAAALIAFAFATSSHATLVSYSATNVADATWRFDYAISNDTLPSSIDYFVIDFDRTQYANLRDATAPAGWDILLLQPDEGLPADGVFDALALSIGILPGELLTGFSVLVDYLGVGAPPIQSFAVLDPFSFEAIDSGTPVHTPVPVPVPLMLLGSALLGIPLARRIRKRRTM
jgi:hypothetical protein